MVALKKDSEEAMALINYVENSGCESTVMQIFKVCYVSSLGAQETNHIFRRKNLVLLYINDKIISCLLAYSSNIMTHNL